MKALPNFPDLHITLGDFYANQGITCKAIEAYRQALGIDPGNIAIKKRLEKIVKDKIGFTIY